MSTTQLCFTVPVVEFTGSILVWVAMYAILNLMHLLVWYGPHMPPGREPGALDLVRGVAICAAISLPLWIYCVVAESWKKRKPVKEVLL